MRSHKLIIFVKETLRRDLKYECEQVSSGVCVDGVILTS